MSAELDQAHLEDLMIRSYLEGRGMFDVRITGSEVWVETDSYYDKQALIEEIDALGFEPGPAKNAQGFNYFVQNNLKDHTQGYNQPRAATTYVAFDPSVPALWKQAFLQARTLWGISSSTDCVGFVEGSGPAGSSQITVTVAEAGTADGGTPADAVAQLPTLYRASTILRYYIVGSYIKIDPSAAGWTDLNAMRRLALHEMGHTLGFTHPWKGSNIAGTATNSNRDSCCVSSYPTVMDYSSTPTVPSADDAASLAIVFRKRDVLGKGGQVVGQTCDY